MEDASIEGLAQAWLQVLHFCRSWSKSIALKAAMKLEVMDILAQQAAGRMLSAAQIVDHFRSPISASTSLQAAAASLDRILRALASHGLLLSAAAEPSGASAVTTYAISLAGSLLSHSREPSLAPLVHATCCTHELELHEAVLDGAVPFIKRYGLSFFPYMERHASLREAFNRGLATHTALVMPVFLQAYSGFAHISGTLVDVGGATGAFLRLILSTYPHIKGINYDLDYVIATAPQFPGLEHVGGDMFDRIPHGDVIFMKWILHDWSDEDCLKILKNCYEALPREGKVIAIELVLPSKVECDVRAQASYQMDLIMMAFTEGKERTFEEFEHLAKASGFETARMMCELGGYAVLELYKR